VDRRICGLQLYRAYAQEALELAEVAFKGFARKSASGDVIGIYWKMSTDLSRPLTFAMGLHDALDGFVTFREIQHVISKTNAKTSNDLTAAVKSIFEFMSQQRLEHKRFLGNRRPAL